MLPLNKLLHQTKGHLLCLRASIYAIKLSVTLPDTMFHPDNGEGSREDCEVPRSPHLGSEHSSAQENHGVRSRHSLGCQTRRSCSWRQVQAGRLVQLRRSQRFPVLLWKILQKHERWLLSQLKGQGRLCCRKKRFRGWYFWWGKILPFLASINL